MAGPTPSLESGQSQSGRDRSDQGPDANHEGGRGGRAVQSAGLVEPTLLKRAATLSDVGNVATFLASDLAASITSTEINISCGAVPD